MTSPDATSPDATSPDATSPDAINPGRAGPSRTGLGRTGPRPLAVPPRGTGVPAGPGRQGPGTTAHRVLLAPTTDPPVTGGTVPGTARPTGGPRRAAAVDRSGPIAPATPPVRPVPERRDAAPERRGSRRDENLDRNGRRPSHQDVAPRPAEPPLPEEITIDLLDGEVRRDLRGLPKDLADLVGRHLVAVGELLDDDPGTALAHARFARFRASRIAVVREAAGLAAYHAGEWAEALGELRASRRMGGAAHLPVMADAERALGRPERALDIARSPDAVGLPPEEAAELLIVTSGARRDLGETGAAVVGLQVPQLDVRHEEPWTARLFYAYGEALLADGRRDEAVRAFLDAAQADAEGETDAEERAARLAAGDDALPEEPLPEEPLPDEFGDEPGDEDPAS